MFCLLQGRPSTFAVFLQTSGHQEGQSPHVPLRPPVQPLNNLTLFAACHSSLTFSCRPLAAICPAGWLSFSGSCYWLRVKKWQDAEAHCVKEQAHLASFHSQEELSFITAHMPGAAWVGLNDISVEGQFVYTDGTPADFLPWAPSQPDNWQNEDCVQLRGMNDYEPGKFSDDSCTSTKEFICKKESIEGFRSNLAQTYIWTRG
uniref:C-type lectin domain-containing protein n=1 Tax=Mola mola TaxID=94237 RepID=A0A3Q3VNV6_MOLML